MPKLSKEQLKNVKYVSLKDFSNRIDQIEDIEAKISFATRYLLTHGIGEVDCSFKEAIHVARMKIAESSLKLKEKLYNDDNLDLDPADYPIDDNPAIVNAFVEDEKDDLENQMFMGNPVGYLKGKAKDLADEIEEQDIELEDELTVKENCIRLGQELNNMNKNDVLKVDVSSNALDIKLRLDAKFGNRNIAKEMKPGFFSRVFVSSRAFANLDMVYKAFNNPNHVLYGDINALEKAANQYLEHRFPGWKTGDQLPTDEQIARLSGTNKSSTEFSVAVINATKEHKKVYDHFTQLVSTTKDKNIKYEDIKEPQNGFQQNFQNQLKIDLSDDDSELEEDSVDHSQILSKARESVDESIEIDDDNLSVE